MHGSQSVVTIPSRRPGGLTSLARLLLLSAGVVLLTIDLARAAEGASTDLTTEALHGEYSIGAGPNRTDLTLARSGAFAMRSRADLGGERQVQGRWHVIDSDVILWVKRQGRVHRWALKAVPHASGFDLVPEEVAAIYAENPTNIGGRYRRVSPVVAVEPKVPDGAGAEGAWSGDSPAAQSAAASAKAPAPERGRVKVMRVAAPSAARPISGENAASSALKASTPEPRAATRPMMSTFVYKPAPHTPIATHLLKSPGLARLSLNAQGNVTAVTILQSTGSRDADAEAVDTFRRWKAKPGAPRDVELPLTWAVAGKRIPHRVPTSSGSMTSG